MTATSATQRVLAFLAVAAALLAGLFAFGRISDDATVSMGLTAIWFGLVFAAAAVLVRRRRGLFWPLAAGYGAVAVAAAILVVAPTLIDKEVDERVVTASGANVRVARGEFVSIAHHGRGTAAVVELPGDERKLTLTGFETDPGPDLRVYVSTGDPASGDLGDFEDLGELKGNVGNQQYTLPRNVDLERYSTVVVWCRAFSVAFTSAGLQGA
jgi:Electron transfer DM13